MSMDEGTFNKMNRRTFLKLAGAAGGIMASGLPLAACAPQQAAKSLFEAKTGATGLNVTPAQAAWFIGEIKGFFKEEGIKNEVAEFQGGPDLARGITEGGLHYASIGTSPLITAFMQGASVKIIGGHWAASTSSHYAVKADSPYKTLADLKGKKIGYSRPSSLTHFLLLRALKNAGLSDKDYTLVAVGGVAESRTALLAGIVDASYMVEVLMAQGLADKTMRVLFYGFDQVPNWQETVFTTKPEFMQSNADVLKRFLRAYHKTLQWQLNNREEAGKLYAEAVKIDQGVSVQLMTAAPKEAFTIKLTPSGLKEAEDSLRVFNLVDKPIPWKDLIDQSLMPSELKVDLPI